MVCRCIVDFVYTNIGLSLKLRTRDASVMSTIFNPGLLTEVAGMELHFR